MDDSKPEVNATPLIDVLLVLLVMFILTVPVATHQSTVSLPYGVPTPIPVTEIRLAIDFDGRMFWNGNEIADDAELSRYLSQVASAADRPVVRVEPDRRARYERVAQVLAAAQRSHVERISIRGVNN